MVNKWDTNYTLKVNQKKNFRNFTLQQLTFKWKDFNINYLLHFWSKGREISKRCLDRWHNRSLTAWSPASHSTEDNTMMPMTAVVITKPNQLITKLNWPISQISFTKTKMDETKNWLFTSSLILSDEDNYWFLKFQSLDQYYTRPDQWIPKPNQAKSIQSQLQSTPRPMWIKPKFYCSPPLSHSQALLQPPRLLNSDFIMILWWDIVVKYCWN